MPLLQQLQPFNPSKSKGLNIEAIFSAPLVAAASANTMMLKEQTKFIMDFCFCKRGDVYDPVLIEMSLTRSFMEPTESGSELRTIHSTFMLPLITIIPINNIAIENVVLNFDMEITSQSDIKTAEGIGASSDHVQSKPVLRGKVSNTSSNNSSTKLSVKIEAGTIPLPLGITTLLDIYVKSIQPIIKTNNKKKKKSKKSKS